ncbi:MAG: mechanosensitive ion channel [Pirellulales bacterium]|nr:mechanosensitive ion channel [Pirellulales bacterium]
MFSGGDPNFFPGVLLASSLSSWLREIARGTQSHFVLYPIVIAGLLLTLWLIYLVFRFLIFRPIAKSQFASKSVHFNQIIESRILGSMASVVAVVAIDVAIDWLPNLDKEFVVVAHRVIGSMFIVIVAHMLIRIARLADAYYSSLPTINRKNTFAGYITVGSFVVYSIAIILVISVLMNKSPIYFVTALGAMSAVLLIVFRDTLLSMFANVIVTTGDLVRVGDWISVKGSEADGYVTEVSLNVVKVQNFDKTITSLPTYTLVQSAFINWRGMFDAGGRRIKRSIYLDQRSIRMLAKSELEEITSIPLMDQALTLEQQSVEGNPECAGGPRITNSGLFRQYVLAYLQQHPKIHNTGMTLLVRQLQPTPTGLPIELYCFTTDTRWAFYEDIQATIFDHLFAMLPVFGLRAYQSESDFAETDVTSRIVDLKRDAMVPYEGAAD